MGGDILMSYSIEKFFNRNVDDDVLYPRDDGSLSLISVYYKKNNRRILKAKEEYKKIPVPISVIVSYLDNFLNQVSVYNRTNVENINLNQQHHDFISRAILVKNCPWNSHEYYDEIMTKYNLASVKDIVWLKFTEDGYLGVVGSGNFINFDYDTSSSALIKVNNKLKKWNETVIVIVPLTKDLFGQRHTRKELKRAIGNFLISKHVPIIDYYSHNHF